MSNQNIGRSKGPFIVRPLGPNQPAYALNKGAYILYCTALTITYTLLALILAVAVLKPPFDNGRVLAPWLIIFAVLFVGAIGFCARASLALAGEQLNTAADELVDQARRQPLRMLRRFAWLAMFGLAIILFGALGLPALALAIHQQPVSLAMIIALVMILAAAILFLNNWKKS